jgi:hypothetical protein
MTKPKVNFCNFFKSAKNDNTSDQHLRISRVLCSNFWGGIYTTLLKTIYYNQLQKQGLVIINHKNTQNIYKYICLFIQFYTYLFHID